MPDLTLIKKKLIVRVNKTIKPFFILLMINTLLALIFSPQYPLESIGSFYILEGGFLLALGGGIPLFSRSHYNKLKSTESSNLNIANKEESNESDLSQDSGSTGRFLIETSLGLLILGILFDSMSRLIN